MELPLDVVAPAGEAHPRRDRSRRGAPTGDGTDFRLDGGALVGVRTAERPAGVETRVRLQQAKRLGQLSRWALVATDAATVGGVTALFSFGLSVSSELGVSSGMNAAGSGLPDGGLPDGGLPDGGLLSLALLLLGALVITGPYVRLVAHPAVEMRRTLLTVGVVFAAAAGAAFAFGVDTAVGGYLVAFGALGVALAPAGRLAGRLAFGRSGWWGAPVAVIASADAGAAILDALRRWPEVGLRPVVLLEEGAGDAEEGGLEREGARWEGGVWRDDLRRASSYAVRYGIREAVVVLPEGGRHRHADDLRRYTRFFRRVFVVDGEPGFGAVCDAASRASGLSGQVVRDADRDRAYQLVKRSIDVVGASVLIVALSPLLAVIAALIKLDGGGRVFYRQRRMGRGGLCYFVHKFRTMHADADRRLVEILEADPALREEYRVFHKLEVDPRVTGVGRVLRRLSLDELPQLWNVLVGEMSLVGPRAYIPAEISAMQGLERVVLQSRPGITGLWQVSGRNALPFAARVQLDVHYVQSSSGWLDCYILARTLPVVLRREGVN